MADSNIAHNLIRDALNWYDAHASYKLSPTGGGSRKPNAIDHVPQWVPMARQYFSMQRLEDRNRKALKRNKITPKRPSVRNGGAIE